MAVLGDRLVPSSSGLGEALINKIVLLDFWIQGPKVTKALKSTKKKSLEVLTWIIPFCEVEKVPIIGSIEEVLKVLKSPKP